MTEPITDTDTETGTETEIRTDAESRRDTQSDDDTVRVAFVCVRNAGRSQMSLAFAEREVERRGLGDEVELLSGGTRPADRVHDEVAAVMTEAGFDPSDRTPREISAAELRSCDYVATMGCSTLDVGAVGDDTDVRDWALADPHGEGRDRVREIRDEIERKVAVLFDEIGPRDG